MSDDDKKLLEMVAKAAGIKVIRSRLDDAAFRDFLIRNSPRNNGQEFGPWNPLEDDGDALRLAINLNLPIVPHTHGIGWIDVGYVKELCGADPLAATRRAIVRAAAQLGARQ